MEQMLAHSRMMTWLKFEIKKSDLYFRPLIYCLVLQLRECFLPLVYAGYNSEDRKIKAQDVLEKVGLGDQWITS